MRAIILYVLLILAIPSNLKAQCPTPGFDLPADVCIDESITITNTSAGAISYLWDFCPGDLSNSPTASESIADNGLGLPYHFKVVEEAGNYYAFVPGRTSQKLVRLDFGTSLDNTPQLVDLGNIGSLFVDPFGIDVIKEGSDWYAIITDFNTADIYRVEFGPSIENEFPSITEFSGFGWIRPTKPTITNEGGEVRVHMGDFGNSNLLRLDFGNSITNPTPAGTSVSISGGSQMEGLSMLKYCDQWYGIISSQGNDKIYRLQFDSGLGMNPTVEQITVIDATFDRPAGTVLAFDGGEFYSLVQTRFGDLYSFNFGGDLTSPPLETNLGNLSGALGANSWGLQLIKNNSTWTAWHSNFTPAEISKIDFPDLCSANIPSSLDTEPNGISFNQSGSFDITLQAFNASGDFEFLEKTLLVTTDIAPDISFTSSNVCISSGTDFTSINTSGNIISYDWDFGDTNSSTDPNPSHTYAAAGDYDVSLSVVSDDGCTNIFESTISVYDEPVASFTLPPGTPCTNQDITFTNTSVANPPSLVTYSWDFNAEGQSTDENPTFGFETSGMKNVSLTVSIPGCDIMTSQILDIKQGPIVSFVSDSVCLGQEITFLNQATGENITAYDWDFGDGFTFNSTEPDDPTHTYLDNGNFQVQLQVTNVDGCQTTFQENARASALPVVTFINNLSCAGTDTQFFDQSTVEDDNIVDWQWDFGDPTSPDNFSTDRNPLHLYTTDGSYLVNLVTTSESGCVESTEIAVDVLPTAIIDFDATNTCEGETTSFQDLTQANGPTITSYLWTIDGQTFTAANPTFQFDAAGIYPVSMTLTLDNNCSLTLSKNITISQAPILDFDISNACVGDIVLFTDVSDTLGQVVITTSWDFGGLGTGIGSEAGFTFNQTGTYDVELNLQLEGGCQRSFVKPVTIAEEPSAMFEPSFTTGAPPLTVNFDNQSQNATLYSWLINGTVISTQEDLIITFEDLGQTTVQLIAENLANCSDTTQVAISIVEPSLDLELTQVNQIDAAGDKQLVLSITNNGSLVIDDLDINISLDNRIPLREKLVGVIKPFESLNYTLANQFSAELLAETNFICVELVFDGGSTQDQDLVDNTKCLNLNDQVVIQGPFPNPVSDMITIEVLAKEVSPIMIALVHSNGDLVLEADIANPLVGVNVLTMDVRAFNAGLYFLQVRHAGVVNVSRLFIK